jgi:hypothetical protein
MHNRCLRFLGMGPPNEAEVVHGEFLKQGGPPDTALYEWMAINRPVIRGLLPVLKSNEGVNECDECSTGSLDLRV